MNVSSTTTRRRRLLALVTGLATTSTLLQAPAAQAATTLTDVNHACTQYQAFSSSTEYLQAIGYQVTAPATVKVGDTFSVTVTPQSTTFASDVSRLAMRFSADNVGVATLDSVTLANTGDNLIGTPKVTNTLAGHIVIVDGGATSHAGNYFFPPSGLQASAGQAAMPAVTFNFTATGAGDAKVRLYSDLAGNLYNAFSFSGQRDGRPAHVYCNNGGVDTLASVQVLDADSAVEKASTTTFLDGETVNLPADGGEKRLPVQVKDADGVAVTSGDVVFSINNEEQPPVAVSSQGIAELVHTFPATTGSREEEYVVTARFTGTDGVTASSGNTIVVVAGQGTVTPPPTAEVATTLKVSATQLPLEDNADTVAYTVQAQVAAASGTIPDGSEVVFILPDGTRTPANVSSGNALAQIFLPENSGEQTIKAEFTPITVGDTTYTASTGSTTVTVPTTQVDTRPPAVNYPVIDTSLKLTATPTSVAVGSPVTLRAVYKPASGSAADATITFRFNGVQVATATTNDQGVAEATATVNQAGPITVDATTPERLVGEVINAGAMAQSVKVTTVNATTAATTTALTVTPDLVPLGGTVTLAATVSPAPKAEGLYVSFFDGDTLLGEAPVDPATGKATFTTPLTNAGTHRLGASFNGGIAGDTNYQASTAQAVTASTTDGSFDFVVPVPPQPTVPAEGSSMGEGSSQGQQGSSSQTNNESSSPVPVVLAIVLALLAGSAFFIPQVRQQLNLPPLPPLPALPQLPQL